MRSSIGFRSLALGIAVTAALGGSAASADIVITNPSGAGNFLNDQNVLVQEPGLISSGTLVQGATNQTHTIVDFDSGSVPVQLTEDASGQAKVVAPSGFQYLDIYLDPKGSATFQTLIFNVLTAEDGQITVTATEPGGAETSSIFALSKNGNNWFNLEATHGQSILNVNLFTTVAMTQVSDLQQVRIGGLESVAPVPLPAAAWMGLVLMGGYGGTGLLRKWKSSE